MFKKPSTVVAFVVALAIFLVGAMKASALDSSNVSHIVVKDITGGAVAVERLTKFHQNLRQRLGLTIFTTPPGDVSDLWRFNIGCNDCQNLDDGTATQLTYYMYDPTYLPAFMGAWEWVQIEDLSETFVMTIDGEKTPDPTCNGYISACSVNYSCPQYANCSQKTTSCVKCTK